jgi:hypothetical protein
MVKDMRNLRRLRGEIKEESEAEEEVEVKQQVVTQPNNVSLVLVERVYLC